MPGGGHFYFSETYVPRETAEQEGRDRAGWPDLTGRLEAGPAEAPQFTV